MRRILLATICLVTLSGCGKDYLNANTVTGLSKGTSIDDAFKAIGREPDAFRNDDDGCCRQGYIAYSEYHGGLIPYVMRFCPDEQKVYRLDSTTIDYDHLKRMQQRDRELAAEREAQRIRQAQMARDFGNAMEQSLRFQNLYQQTVNPYMYNSGLEQAHREGMDALDRVNRQIQHEELMRRLDNINSSIQYR